MVWLWVHHYSVIASFYIEEFEKMVSKWATHRPISYIWYVNDTIVIWPHELEKLKGFLNHLNYVRQDIQLTVGTERDGHLPFLDISITGDLMAPFVIRFAANSPTHSHQPLFKLWLPPPPIQQACRTLHLAA
jgi:hypothetical protein